jgi:hypothetical protein
MLACVTHISAVKMGQQSTTRKSIISSHTMTNSNLRTGTETEFFRRGKDLARLADSGKQLSQNEVESFDHPPRLSWAIVDGDDTDLDTLSVSVSCEANRHVTES